MTGSGFVEVVTEHKIMLLYSAFISILDFRTFAPENPLFHLDNINKATNTFGLRVLKPSIRIKVLLLPTPTDQYKDLL